MNGLQRWLKPWQQPAPWLALLLVVLLAGWAQALRPPKS